MFCKHTAFRMMRSDALAEGVKIESRSEPAALGIERLEEYLLLVYAVSH